MTPEQLFEKNQNLVYYCMKRVSRSKLWYEDCLQEGFIELWRVCQKFEPERGLAFATYAVPCIQGAMQRFCRENCSTIRIPRTMWEKGEVDQVVIRSLDALVDDEKSDNTTYGDFIPAEPDFYSGLFEDQIDDFLATLPDGRYKDVCEEFAYGAAYGDSPKQVDMAVKYHCGQPQIARYRKRFREQFRQFLNDIQKGGD